MQCVNNYVLALISLKLPQGYDLVQWNKKVSRCPLFPQAADNPSIGTGSYSLINQLSYSNSRQYFCQITVLSDCFNSVSSWIQPAAFKQVEVPENAPYSIIVDYYDSCSDCNYFSPYISRMKLTNKVEFFQSVSAEIDLTYGFDGVAECY